MTHDLVDNHGHVRQSDLPLDTAQHLAFLIDGRSAGCICDPQSVLVADRCLAQLHVLANVSPGHEKEGGR